MKLHELPLYEIINTLEWVMDDYFIHHLEDEDVQTECIEKFFEHMDGIATFHGMTKMECDMFCDILLSIYDNILNEKKIEENEEELQFEVDEELPF